ncbi:MAG: SRPBCC domain-containing protein [Proteobacteria bacterium]|nr:MAG: SRPBCC domain-containing protein [Pseudomonadota bacterium]
MAQELDKPVRIYANLKGKSEQVFDAWLDPKKIAKWMTVPAGDKSVKVKTKALPGTQFSFINLRDGQEINHIGEYIEIRRPHRLVFTWGIEGQPMGASRVAIDFEPNGEETLLTLTHRGVNPEYLERTENGWKNIIAALETTV